MEYIIKSKKLNRTLTFSLPGKSYIFVNLNGKAGTLGTQICSKGSTMGHTLSYEGSDEKVFKKICKKWYRAYLYSMSIVHEDL